MFLVLLGNFDLFKKNFQLPASVPRVAPSSHRRMYAILLALHVVFALLMFRWVTLISCITLY